MLRSNRRIYQSSSSNRFTRFFLGAVLIFFLYFFFGLESATLNASYKKTISLAVKVDAFDAPD